MGGRRGGEGRGGGGEGEGERERGGVWYIAQRRQQAQMLQLCTTNGAFLADGMRLCQCPILVVTVCSACLCGVCVFVCVCVHVVCVCV